MDRGFHALAVALRWMAVLWLVAWALYATIWDERSAFYLRDTLSELGALLIPAAVAFAGAWGLDRMPTPHRGGRQVSDRYLRSIVEK